MLKERGNVNTMQVHNKKSLQDIRRNLRQEMTEAEKMLWKFLRAGKLSGIKFKRQHSIGNYIVDFYCARKKLIIEVDGEIHNDATQKEKDILRDENLKEMNFVVLRFTNSEVLNEIESVLNTIESYC